MIEAGARGLGVTLDAPAKELATAVIALSEGYLLQRLIDPRAIEEGFFVRVLFRFFGRLVALQKSAG
jgi:hypothetical protein